MKLSSTLIGLGGRLRSGKDVVADRLVAEHGFVKLGMSDALHEAMLAIDPWIFVNETTAWETAHTQGWQRYSDAVNRTSYVETKRIPEARRLLQNLGTEVGRNMIGENVWVNIMARKIDDHRGAGHPVVVTGIRFPNEIQMIQELGGRSVWIERPENETGLGGAPVHSSENSVTPEDFGEIIHNDGSLEELRFKASTLVTR